MVYQAGMQINMLHLQGRGPFLPQSAAAHQSVHSNSVSKPLPAPAPAVSGTGVLQLQGVNLKHAHLAVLHMYLALLTACCTNRWQQADRSCL